MLQGRKYPIYVEKLPASPKVHSTLLQGRSFLSQLRFLISAQATTVNLKFSKKKSLKIGNSKFQKSQTQLCEDHEEEIQENLKKLSAAICRRSSVLKFSLPQSPMLTKTKKNIRKKIEKIKKCLSAQPRGSNNQNLKEIRALRSEIIATPTDGRRTNFDVMTFADSQAQLKRFQRYCGQVVFP